VKPAGANRAGGRATTGKVTVFGWRNLTSLDPVGGQSLYAVGAVAINGTTYPNSISGSTGFVSGSIDYNLNRDCKAIEAVYGLADSSATLGSAALGLYVDGAQAHSGTYRLTQAQRVVTDLTGAFRITIGATAADGGIPAVGTPKVLCSF
jgi:hypothetical protein